jgi:nucleotide-binding universal stress UspA family protein
MKNILLAFDGSEYSNRALQYAKMFADRFEATLWLVHVFTHTSDLLGYEDYEKLYSKRKASGQTLLNEAFQELIAFKKKNLG